jgi:hypothetical protein
VSLFQRKHELWLQILFASFSVNDPLIKEKLYDFSQIAFRHLKWIAKQYREQNHYYNYQRTEITIRIKDTFSLLSHLKEQLIQASKLYSDDELGFRMSEDEKYLISVIELWQTDITCNTPITAFDRHMSFDGKNLSTEQRDALILFLFEESYKEYELIMVYFYMQNYTDEIKQFDVYQDLIDESHFHLKSFGNMMAKMGLLAIPREVHEMSYKITDLEQFILNGIDEELNAKEECRRLAEAVNDPELEDFFNFINYQENYHIELMKRLL